MDLRKVEWGSGWTGLMWLRTGTGSGAFVNLVMLGFQELCSMKKVKVNTYAPIHR
jgi:hypothetical protein